MMFLFIFAVSPGLRVPAVTIYLTCSADRVIGVLRIGGGLVVVRRDSGRDQNVGNFVVGHARW